MTASPRPQSTTDHPGTPPAPPRSSRLSLVAVAVAGLVVVGSSACSSQGGDDKASAKTHAGSARPGAGFKGLQAGTGKELEKYLLGKAEAPGGMAIEPDSLTSEGSASAPAPADPPPSTKCDGEQFGWADKVDVPNTEVTFRSGDGTVSLTQGIMAAPSGSATRILSFTRRDAERCPNSDEAGQDGQKMHTSLKVENLKLGDESFRIRSRVLKSTGGAPVSDSQAVYVRMGDTVLMLMAVARGRELSPGDGLDETVTKAMTKIQKTA